MVFILVVCMRSRVTGSGLEGYIFLSFNGLSSVNVLNPIEEVEVRTSDSLTNGLQVSLNSLRCKIFKKTHHSLES